jgi:predicted DNA-binding transcriptional regulator AlpA
VTRPSGPVPRVSDLGSLPPTVNIETAAKIIGIGRTLAYELAKDGKFPCRVLQIGDRYIVPSAGLIQLLSVDGGESDSRDPDYRGVDEG